VRGDRRRTAVAVAALLLAGCAGAARVEPGDAGLDAGDAGDSGAGDSDAGRSDAGDAGDAADAGADAGTDAGPPDAGSDAGTNPLITARPYHFHLPAGYVAGQPLPLLVMFHGYGSTAVSHEAYLLFTTLSDEKGFLYAYADGTLDTTYQRFWNATDACCDIYASGVDDTAYAAAILDDVEARYAVDPKRIFLFGHSNGGFMVHRLACELSGRIAGVVSLAGMNWKDPSRCHAQSRVAVLQIHGNADQVIHYDGGRVTAPWMGEYPSAHDTVATWAAIDGCGPLVATGETRDIDSAIPGAETTVERYQGCQGGAVEIWTVQGGPHQPPLTATWSEPVWNFLTAHPRQ
jgi:polyhydroxybutyrate depolymerase